MKCLKPYFYYLLTLFFVVGCTSPKTTKETQEETKGKELLENYVKVKLNVDISHLSEKEKQIIPILIEAADLVDEIFWLQSIGEKERVMDSIESDELKLYASINYGTWDRLNAMEPFVDKFGIKPLGSRFYPAHMTIKEFDALKADDKYDYYTLIWRKNDGSLFTIPYHEAYKEQVTKISELLNKAADIAEDENLKKYLELRAEAFLTDNYYESDMAWMDNTTGNIDLIIGPIEYSEDRLFRAKAAHGALILVKDRDWSERLQNTKEYLPRLQEMLPVDEKYKQEDPITSADLSVYNVIYCAGDFNAGSKKISITLPFDGRVQMEKGSRKLQFKNALNAKFEKIILPIVDIVIDENQRQNVHFDAFFENTMYYEVGNCLGCRNTINNKGTVKEALKEYYFTMEESKSDILSLFFITKLQEAHIFTEKNILDNYVTYLVNIFRSIRFGSANPQAQANIMRLNYFLNEGALIRNPETGTYAVDQEKMKIAVEKLANRILKLRGDGDYEGVKQLFEENTTISKELDEDIARIAAAGIPKDVYFEQGLEVLGLQ